MSMAGDIFSKFILHPNTRRSLEEIATSPSQGYLFLGPAGSGKYTTAALLADYWSQGDRGLVRIITPTGQSIGIEEILKLKSATKHKRSDNNLRHTIIIDESGSLTKEAQNALLKSLEEPIAGVTYILIAPHRQSLLPTVVSRLNSITFYPVEKTELVSKLSSLAKDPSEFEKYYYLGHGTPGGITRIAKEGIGDDLLGAAKNFLQASLADRTAIIAGLQKKDRAEQRNFLDSLSMLLTILMRRSAKNDDIPTSKQHALRLGALSEIQRGFEGQINARLGLTRLMLEL